MFQIILAIHIILCFILVALVLLQEGKSIGAEFGAGGSNTLFGAAGIDKPIVRATTAIAVLFMITSILLVNGYAKLGQTAATKAAPLPEELQRINKVVQVENEAAKVEKAVDEDAAKAQVPPLKAPAAENEKQEAATVPLADKK